MKEQPKILIVDDKPANLCALKQTLRELDVETVEAQSGNDALAATLNHDFVLCIVDVQMPEMSGIELVTILKEDAKTRFVPIILLTAALMNEEQMLEGYEVGAVEYVIKPYNPRVLLSKVSVFLELNRQRVQLVEQSERLSELLAERERKDRLIERQARAMEICQLEKLSSLGRMAASLTHELNQPLNVIKLITGDIRRDFRINPFQACLQAGSEGQQRHDAYFDNLHENLADILAQVDRMALIIEHMSRYSRKDQEAEPKAILARAPVDAALQLLAHRMEMDSVAVSVEAEEGVWVQGDQLKLEQVFVNLFGNACDAMHGASNGKAKKLNVTIAASGGNVVFAIRDNGPGIPAESQERIFDPFFTAKSRGEGTGLGLSVVREIISDHGGTIELDPTVSDGASFAVVMPSSPSRKQH